MAIQDEIPKSRLTLRYKTEVDGEPQDVTLPLRMAVTGGGGCVGGSQLTAECVRPPFRLSNFCLGQFALRQFHSSQPPITLTIMSVDCACIQCSLDETRHCRSCSRRSSES